LGPHWPCPEANSSSAPRSTILARPIQAQLIFSIWHRDFDDDCEPDATASANFGSAVALSVERRSSGAPEQKFPGRIGCCLTCLAPNGNALTPNFLESNPDCGRFIGHAVSLEGDAVAIGASLDDTIITNGGPFTFIMP